jgi:hypothetical protein
MLFRSLTLLAAIQLCGLHWASLQCVYWVNMFAENIRTESDLSLALSDTFDIQKMCQDCKHLSEVKKNADDSPPPPSENKQNGILTEHFKHENNVTLYKTLHLQVDAHSLKQKPLLPPPLHSA